MRRNIIFLTATAIAWVLSIPNFSEAEAKQTETAQAHKLGDEHYLKGKLLPRTVSLAEYSGTFCKKYQRIFYYTGLKGQSQMIIKVSGKMKKMIKDPENAGKLQLMLLPIEKDGKYLHMVTRIDSKSGAVSVYSPVYKVITILKTIRKK